MNYGTYDNLEQLLMGRFHEDHAIYGNSIPELVRSYNMTPGERTAMLDEIDRFRQVNSGCLDTAFASLFGGDCDPALWGHTTASFLDELKRLLGE
ncbi:contact-dependent growth inhibition system immunity protein [Paraburkholderia ferrariae]|uniref:contact-dependent growth inhibition system immunity protein n=1 Tax=Paraburkholderia ferrariae TaxID=386056 RepID=UPI000483FAA3|nr:contact-dependent growth inhibition system immunity protein [Paraburkholderia ferrariae]